MARGKDHVSEKRIVQIPTDQIRVLNPRVRNRRNFEEIVENISRVGLKRPITVSRRPDTDPVEYDLVCGQGRLEAFIQLGQSKIPAIVINADERDCLVMSLVENCARRQHKAIDLMREIGALRKRGYNDRQIGEKIGVSAEYVNMIAGLLDRGEERLVSAVEIGTLPLSLAIDISKAEDENAQRALVEAYTEKKLRGKKLAAVLRLLQQRQRRGRHISDPRAGRKEGYKRPLTSDALVRAYRQETDRQKLMIKKAELTQGRLAVFEILRKMKVLRQIEAAELLVNANNYSVAYASAILAGTPQAQLVDGAKPKLLKRMTPEAMARIEGELARLQESFTSIQDSYGQDHLQLTVIKGYVAKLLGNARIVRYLMQNRPDFMAEFQTIAEMTSTLPPEAG